MQKLGLLVVVLFPPLVACSPAGDGGPGLEGTNGGGGGTSGNGAGGGIIPQGGVSGTGTGMRDPNDMRDLPVRKRTCDASGQNCSCLRLALLGTLDSSANNKDTQPFVDWLNGNSGGTATVTMVTTKPSLDAAFLSNYDILVVANVNGWTFSASEKTAVEEWVRTTGGGIVSLTGFVSTDQEIVATSQLVEFAGFGYSSPKTAEGGQGVPVYFDGGAADLKNCLGWSGNSEVVITTPVPFSPLTGNMEKLTFELDYVGAYIGWAVTAPSAATVVSTDPVSGQPIAAALELDGKGRLFVFGDEWVIFRNQWEPAGNPHNMQMDQYNPCWHPPDAENPTGYFHSVRTLYQTKQFWYNAVSWAAPPNECGFIVEDPDVVVR